MPKILKAQDTLSGKEGTAFIEINGQVEELFYLKSLEAEMDKQKSEVKVLGHRGTQNKTVGWSGTGSMTIYYISPLFRRMALEYAKTGRDMYFKMVVTNDDKTSSVGAQSIALYDCNIDSTIIAKLDVDSDALDEDLDFTFADFDILNEFGQPIYSL